MTENEATMMTCDEFREAIAAEPGAAGDGLAKHAETCAACRAIRDEFVALDARIERALAIPVPELRIPELEAPATAKVVALRPRPRVTPPAWFGIAAGLALAAFFGLQFQQSGQQALPLAAQVIGHLDHEPGSLRVTTVAVPERTLDAVVSNEVSELKRDIGLITYARSCVINGKTIPHLVIQGERGPVTLLLMPDEPVDAAVPLLGEGINGVILPVGGGSIAIVGERDEPLGEIQDRVVDSVKWKT